VTGLVLTGCSSSTTNGHPGALVSIGPASSVSTSSAPTTSTPAPTPSVPTSSATSAAGLCGTDTTAPAVAACLRSALSDFWSGQLNETVDEPVYLEATSAQVPQACRPGLTAAPAFTCRSNLTLYINKRLLDLVSTYFPASDLRYALASVQAHEIGHVLQYRLHQPQIETTRPTAAQTRFVEQQADCLSGVWARHASVGAGFDRAAFRRDAVRLVTLVSSNVEIQTHGTPAQRAAAIDRGLASGRPQTCKLVTFS
jgi:predicted metalloprotease